MRINWEVDVNKLRRKKCFPLVVPCLWGLMMRSFFSCVSNIFMSPLWIHWSLSILVIIVLLYFFYIHTSSICSPDVFFFLFQFCYVAQVVLINKYIEQKMAILKIWKSTCPKFCPNVFFNMFPNITTFYPIAQIWTQLINLYM